MVLLMHVIVALLSLVSAAYAFFLPSNFKLRVSVALVALTLGSGSYVVWTTHAHMLQACTTGLLYIGATVALMIAARTRLAHSKVSVKGTER